MRTFSVSPRSALALRAIALMTLCGAIAFLLGKDSNWDLLSYHLYIAHAFWTQDLQSDFMAAGVPRYFNPIGYLPFYWMIKAGWHSLTVGLLLAAFHSLTLLLLWEICAKYLFKSDSRPGLLASLAVALAAMSPVFLGTLGGTYLDQTTLVFIFGGLLLLCIEIERPSSTILLPLLAGTLIGIAAALKLTNVIYIASAGAAILIAARFKPAGWRTALWYGVGIFLGAILAGGWWSFQLYREFGNPFFPLFNEYFQSPDFPSVKLSHERFKPASFIDALTFPFDMAKSRSWIYVENAAADTRFALLAVLALIWVIERERRKRANLDVPIARNISAELIIAFFLVSIPAWMVTTCNGRYALPILLLVAPILILAARAASPDRKWFAFLLIFIFSLQGIVMSRNGNPRWDTGLWTAKWIDVEVPAKLRDNAYGYLSVGSNSNSFLALNLHPESRLVNLLGVYPLSLDNPGGKRVSAFISAHAGRLRTLGSMSDADYRELIEKDNFADYLNDIDGRFAMWDLRTDPTDCLPIKFSESMIKPTQKNNSIIVSCALLPGNPLRASTIPVWERASRIFDRIESACPALFSPRGLYATKRGKMWYRLYFNTDVMLFLLDGRISYSRFAFGPFDVDMGTPEEWETGTATWVCRVPLPQWKLPVTQ